jgi:Zn-dependent protease/CBS domain-containing protein
MRWSFRIARVAGIDIKLHVTFILILLLGAVQWGAHAGGPGAVAGAVAMALLFVCVALHELGHSLTAIRFGIPVREIILWPLGGVAMMTRNPSRPLHELLIAVAGPAVNVVIAIALFLPLYFSGILAEVIRGIASSQTLQPDAATIVVWLLIANVMLAVFNLLPALPMDGGRVLRASLAMFVEGSRATQIAGRIGQGMALLMGLGGLVTGNLILVLIAVFVFFVASQELGESRVAPVLKGWRAGHVYDRQGVTLAPGDTIGRVVSLLLSSHQRDFPVLHGGRLHGVISRDDVLRSLSADPRDRYVTEVMKREVMRVPSEASLDRVRNAMSERGASVVAVIHGQQFLGLLSSERLSDVYALLRVQPVVDDPSRAAA